MPARTKTVLIASVALISLGTEATFGQDKNENSGQVTVLAPITVTATKREQEIGKVDAAISVVSGDELVARGVHTVDDLQKVFPGLSIGNRGNRVYSNITVRGLSSPDYFNPTVQIYVDGVPQLPSTFSQPIANIERVELLRGPQGTLYGANAFGGVINIITKTPDRNRFYTETTISAEEPSIEMGGTLAIVPDVLFFDFAGTFSHFSGDIDDRATGRDDINTSNEGTGRASLRYAPAGGDFDATLSYSHERLKSHEELYSLERDVKDRIYDSSVYGEVPVLERDIDTASAQWNYRFDDFTLSSTTAYQESDVRRDFSAGPGSRYLWPQNDKAVSQEIRLAYEGTQFSGVGGLWYMHDDFTGLKNGYPGFYGDSSNNVVTDSAAVFGEATWHATDRLDLTAGLRGTYDRSTIDASRVDLYGNGFGFDFENKDNFRSLQPKFAIGYDATSDVRLFGVVSRGYKAGGFNHSISSTIDAAPYDPESAWNFEVGVKSTLLDGALDISASVYHVRSSNKQIYVGIIGQQFIRNVGEATSTGIEIEGVWRATDRFTLTGNAALGRSKFTEFTDPYTGVIYNGNLVPYAPDVTAHVYASYILSEEVFGGTLTANGGVNFTSKTYFDEANVAGQGAFSTFDASLELAMSSGFSARLYAQNIADKSYKTSGYVNGATEFGTLGKGRTIGLTLRKEF